MGQKNFLSEQGTTGNELIEVNSVWRKKRIQSREDFFRKALIQLAEAGMAPELFFADFQLTEFEDEFLTVSADIHANYTCEIGTPRTVKTTYFDEDDFQERQARKVVIDWELVKDDNHTIIDAAINKNWNGEMPDSKSVQTDYQYKNKFVLEDEITEMYEKSRKIAKNDDDFPNKGMTGEYEKQTIDSFKITHKAQDRILNKCFVRACKEYRNAKHARNLQYSGYWEILKVYGIIIPRYKLSFVYNGSNYSAVDRVWNAKLVPDFEQAPPLSYNGKVDKMKLRDKMNEAIEKAQNAKKPPEAEQETLSFFGKLGKVLRKVLLGGKKESEDENKVSVKIQLSTPNGIVEEIVTYDKQNDGLFSASERKTAQRAIALANALARYNLAPMTEDNYINLTNLSSYETDDSDDEDEIDDFDE